MSDPWSAAAARVALPVVVASHGLQCSQFQCGDPRGPRRAAGRPRRRESESNICRHTKSERELERKSRMRGREEANDELSSGDDEFSCRSLESLCEESAEEETKSYSCRNAYESIPSACSKFSSSSSGGGGRPLLHEREHASLKNKTVAATDGTASYSRVRLHHQPADHEAHRVDMASTRSRNKSRESLAPLTSLSSGVSWPATWRRSTDISASSVSGSGSSSAPPEHRRDFSVSSSSRSSSDAAKARRGNNLGDDDVTAAVSAAAPVLVTIRRRCRSGGRSSSRSPSSSSSCCSTASTSSWSHQRGDFTPPPSPSKAAQEQEQEQSMPPPPQGPPRGPCTAAATTTRSTSNRCSSSSSSCGLADFLVPAVAKRRLLVAAEHPDEPSSANFAAPVLPPQQAHRNSFSVTSATDTCAASNFVVLTDDVATPAAGSAKGYGRWPLLRRQGWELPVVAQQRRHRSGGTSGASESAEAACSECSSSCDTRSCDVSLLSMSD